MSISEKEYLKRYNSPSYFIYHDCQIYDAILKKWIPFYLWPDQFSTLDIIHDDNLVIILKARQLGLTWLCLCYILWLALFRPAITALLFSRRDDEAMYLLSDERLKGVYYRLPDYAKEISDWKVIQDSAHNWKLANGSIIKAFPTGTGDSYTATIALVDEADLAPDLNKLMGAVKPTIDGGGKLILLSRSNKSKPQSEFKKIYRAAKQSLNDWSHIFLSWYSRPTRNQEWYKAQKRDIITRTGSTDDLHEQYPATDTEALSPKTLDKRIAPFWIEQCYVEFDPIHPKDVPSIPGLIVYKELEEGKEYFIGLDPAEGNPTSNDSALCVLEKETGEQVAELSGKFQPAVLGSHANLIGIYFNNAKLLPERNNHGHAVILWLKDNSKLEVLNGIDGSGNKAGWLSSPTGKTMLYDCCANSFRLEDTIVHSFKAFTQLASIEGASLLAPEGEQEDVADAYALALIARTLKPKWAKVDFLNV